MIYCSYIIPILTLPRRVAVLVYQIQKFVIYVCSPHGVIWV